MTKAIAQTYTVANDHRAYITYALMGVCLFMMLAYAANLYSVISHTVALQKTEKSVTALSAAVDNLDADYIRISSRITPDTLSAHGFSQGHVSAFIPRSTSLGRVALGGYEL
jgi:hypothetical protein